MKQAQETAARSRWMTARRVGGWALAYLLAQTLSFQLPDRFGLVATIRLPAGIGLAALLLSERRQWPALLLGLFAMGLMANLTTPRPALASLGFMIANMCETSASAWLITRCCGETVRFTRSREVLALAGAVLLVNGITALIGAGTAYLTLGSLFWTFYGSWWVADGMGLLLITPLIVVWVRSCQPLVSLGWRQLSEMFLLLVLACLLCWILFGLDNIIPIKGVRPYMLMMLVLWAGLRCDLRGMLTLLGLIALIVIACTTAGIGTFPLLGTGIASRLLAVQIFLMVLSLSGLLLATAVAERQEIHGVLDATFKTLQASKERYQTLFDRANVGICLISLDGHLMDFNESFARIHGYQQEEMRAMKLTDWNSPETAQQHAGRIRRMLAGEMLTFEADHYHKDGQVFALEVTASAIQVGEQSFILCLHRDVTQHKRMEELAQQGLIDSNHSRRALLSAFEDLQLAHHSMEASLREKEALLREIHHRVKNNLQIISSLLYLQADRIDSQDVKDALQDMQNRVHSMALIHEHLYGSHNFAEVDLAAYLNHLCAQLFRLLVRTPDAIQMHLDLVPVHLGIDQAIPCGLLVNELVTNAFKHAFPDGRRGEVRIELQPFDDGSSVRLRVSDNGVGLPAGLDLQHLSSLGLQLVSGLVGQLCGRLEIGPGPGTETVVEFRKSGGDEPGEWSEK